MLSTTASAPAKIILFGEHFVVYDQPVILASINKRLKIECKREVESNKAINLETNNFGKKIYPLSILENSNQDIVNEFFYPILYILRKMIYHNTEPYGITIKIISEIPYGVGLGSSAALCVAGVAAISELYKRLKNKDEILNIAIETERILHKSHPGYRPAHTEGPRLRCSMQIRYFDRLQMFRYNWTSRQRDWRQSLDYYQNVQY